MEVSISAQALSLMGFGALGLGLGLVYDLLRLLRYGLRYAILWDGLFCAIAAAACFCLSMGRGSYGIWEILLCLTAFCGYINCMSPHVFPKIYRFSRLFPASVRFLEKKYFFIKKFLFKQK